MIDVHAPHESTHTWADFFIHIATIAVGLLLAIGLEQTVEAIHHLHQVRETREALHNERFENIRRFHANVEQHIMSMAYLHNNLRIFLYLRDHPGTPQDKLPGILYWSLVGQPWDKSAWSTAESTGVTALMPRDEVSDITASYARLDAAWQSYQPVLTSLTRDTSFYMQTSDITRLSRSDIDKEIESIQQTLAEEAVYGDMLSILGHQRGFGPAPSWWRMLPFEGMSDYYAWARQHPELNAPSEKDIDQARAFAGLPPETPGASFRNFTTR
ncbi:MAG TPA: hypothetical protein VGM11_06135 [Acidobacteriaceae bacterium]|jgi:hypothetical protein